MRKSYAALLTAGLVTFAHAAHAQAVKVGATLTLTGPNASLGIPAGNAIKLLPKTIDGIQVEYVVLDDATDTTRGVANMRKLATDEKVDVVVGSTSTPISLALVEVAAELKLPLISLGGSSKISEPVDEKRRWVFKTPQNDSLIAEAIARHMAKNKVKSAAFIGFNDAYGDGWMTEFTRAFDASKVNLVASERYSRTDTSVTGQILKIVAAKPEAVVIGASGTPAALPIRALRERGYNGKIYVGHGAATTDFLRVGGKDIENVLMATGPVLVADQLPESNPVRAAGVKFTKDYEAQFGPGSANAFGAYSYDAGLLLQKAIPVAAKVARPGTPEFRTALRDAIEGLKNVPATHGIFTMTPTDHNGQDERATVMVVVSGGKWKYLE